MGEGSFFMNKNKIIAYRSYEHTFSITCRAPEGQERGQMPEDGYYRLWLQQVFEEIGLQFGEPINDCFGAQLFRIYDDQKDLFIKHYSKIQTKLSRGRRQEGVEESTLLSYRLPSLKALQGGSKS
jgi:hypothetical protein